MPHFSSSSYAFQLFGILPQWKQIELCMTGHERISLESQEHNV